jgi:hypothetical protein
VAVSNWTEEDSIRALKIWSDYQMLHDLTSKVGQSAGVDPSSGRIWFGDSIHDVVAQQRDSGIGELPLFFIRVGSETYYRKGGHR